MRAIKSKGTSIELMLRKKLFKHGLRFRVHYKRLPGCPDIVFVSKKIAIFCDSEFWHGKNWDESRNKIKSNRDYWIPKIERTIERDRINTKKIKNLGWVVLRFWEQDIRKNLDFVVKKILVQLKLKTKIYITKPDYFSLKNTVLSHGWVHLYPYKWENNNLCGTLDLNNKSFDFSIYEAPKTIVLNISGDLQSVQKKKIVQSVKYALSYDFPTEKFIELCNQIKRSDLALMAAEGWGRLLRSMSPWEDAVKTLLTTNCRWSNTQKMTLEICKQMGKKTKNGKNTFPSPQKIVEQSENLHRLKLGYRAHYLLLLAQKVCSGEVDFYKCLKRSGRRFNEVAKTISSLKGFGDYATNHLLVLFGWYNVLPIDREVMKYLGVKPTSRGASPKNIKNYSEFLNFRYTAYKLDRILKRRNWIGD